MLLEVIATCVQDAITAEHSGADRLELITALTEGGLTPGIGMVQEVVRAVQIPVHVMVRPHSRSFIYDAWDIATMVAEIKAIRSTGAAGIVLGALTEDGMIDERALEQMLAASGSLQVTFHRAFDELKDQMSGLEVLKQYAPVTRILTSGGKPKACDAVPRIHQLVEAAQDSHIRILAGSGLSRAMIRDFVEQTGVSEVHFGTSVRYGQSALAPIHPEELRRVAAALQQLRESAK
ncbi:copper homeostasis protein CutC [Paenibacillus campinasensis]|uniref:PF03932 family protein CutC n=1 Tax=Paenibacillus campinasensis TaxID=66347 RepID=A0ABW9T2Y8_9BACL|nr:copper homeostasis protein CutC [Paenibacillus campinasensis]MUG67484.1 copper homeostasis protein CutC [Paenibacillus campinasensis]